MDKGFRLFPEQASSIAARVDALYLFLVVVSLFFIGVICVAVLGYAIRYRRQAQRDRRNPPAGNLPLEALWTLVPLALALVIFGWGARLYFSLRRPPTDAMELHVVGKQWMWKLAHPEGRREINELHVPVGRPVRLIMTSEDVIHSFFIPAFRIKMDVLPGRYSSVWFEATRPGQYHLFCAEYCGTGHSEMIGRVVVQTPAEYQQWLSGSSALPPVAAGRELFSRLRCDTCHKTDAQGRCPSLAGLFGKPVQLASGQTVIADENYLRESIIAPQAKVVAGQETTMPTYVGQVSEENILDLIAYIQWLSREDRR